MSNDLMPQAMPGGNLPSPFNRGAGLPASVNAGAVAIEQERAVAEAKGQMQLAKMFPRNNNAAYAELMDACKLPALARVAFYNVPRGGSSVSGPSIRLAEEIARIYGNFQYGHRELSRSDGKSEVEVFAWDVERNNRSIRQITVEHTRDTRNGAQALRDQKDIDDKIANVASKQVRGRILALLPKWMVEAAIEECKKTIAGNNDVPIAERVRKMTQAFAKFGVNTGMLEKYLGHKLDDVTGEELADMQGIFNAIREGGSPSEYFGADETQAGKEDAATAEAKETVSRARTTAKAKPQKAAEQAAPAPAEAAAAPAQAPAAQEESNPVKNHADPVESESSSSGANNMPPEPPAPDDDEVF